MFKFILKASHMDLPDILKKAQTSKFYLWLINFALLRKIPFNKPHNIKVNRVTDNSIEIILPYKKSNLNHIKGLHACGIATLAEYVTGLSLIRKLPADKYRIIMKSLKVDYTYQGKSTAKAAYNIDDSWIKEKIFDKLETNDKCEVVCEVTVEDEQNNLLADAGITWQIKDWQKVNTK